MWKKTRDLLDEAHVWLKGNIKIPSITLNIAEQKKKNFGVQIQFIPAAIIIGAAEGLIDWSVCGAKV